MVKYSRTFCGELSDAPRRTRWANAWRAAARICSVAAGSEAPSAPWIKRLWFDIVVLRSFRAGLPESGGVPSQRSRHRLAAGHPASRGTRAAREQRSALIGENDGLGSREEASPPFFLPALRGRFYPRRPASHTARDRGSSLRLCYVSYQAGHDPKPSVKGRFEATKIANFPKNARGNI